VEPNVQRRAGHYNRKRRIDRDVAKGQLDGWADRVCYGGNPEHKRNPGDFGLTPPVSPRPDKELCDQVDVVGRDEALALLRRGLKAGLVSVQRVDGLPQNIWAVTDAGEPIEAQLENRETAAYHGYPLSESDPLSPLVLQAWRARNE
jgi:hypothetical protein